MPTRHWPLAQRSPWLQSQLLLQPVEVLPHCPVAVLHVLFARVREVLPHWLLLQVGMVWMQLVPLCAQEGPLVAVLTAHWLLLQAGVNCVQVLPLMEQALLMVLVLGTH